MKTIFDMDNPSSSATNASSANSLKTRDEIRREIEHKAYQTIYSCKEAQKQIITDIKRNTEIITCLLQQSQIINDEILAKLNNIQTKNEGRVRLLQEQNKTLQNHKMIMKKRQRRTEQAIKQLSEINTSTDTGTTIYEIDDNSTILTLIERFREDKNKIGKTTKDMQDKVQILREALNSTPDDIEDVDIIPTEEVNLIQSEAADADPIPDDVGKVGLISTEAAEVELIPNEAEEVDLFPIEVAEVNQFPNEAAESDLILGEVQNVDLIPAGSEMVNPIPKLSFLKIHESKLVTIETLREFTEPVMELLRQSRIFAIQEFEGKERCARISIGEKDRICLHYLREQALLPNAHAIKHSDVMTLVNSSSKLAFLELSNVEEKLGRMYIRLSSETLRGNHFPLMCTGVFGPSYANTKIFKVDDKGDELEYAEFGDYENQDGTGGKALVPGVCDKDDCIPFYPWWAGAVEFSHSAEKRATQFRILTRDVSSGILFSSIGMVEEGLEVLTEAIQNHPDITEVFISDCGLVLDI